MTRIIAGFAGSLSLAVPPRGTRPTSDRVREAIFSALQSRGMPGGCRVLDLYAGTGALGLEALSRGAAAVTLVERHPQTARICRSNAALVQGRAPKGQGEQPRGGQVQVIAGAVQPFLEQAAAGAGHDLVFIDPPYEVGEAELAAALSALQPLLAEDAVILVERASRSPEPLWPAGIALDRRKDYGDTALWWASAAELLPAQ